MTRPEDFSDDLRDGGSRPEVEAVLRELRRLGNEPAPEPSGGLATFLAEGPTGPTRGRLGRITARVASMGAAGAIVLGGGAVAMACVGAVTVAHVTSQDPKPPASVSTLLPGRAEASESPEPSETPKAGQTARTADPNATPGSTGTAAGSSPETTASPEASRHPGANEHSTANHTDGRGQDDQHAAAPAGGPGTLPPGPWTDLWREGAGQGFHGPKGGGPGQIPPVGGATGGGSR